MPEKHNMKMGAEAYAWEAGRAGILSPTLPENKPRLGEQRSLVPARSC